jgi:hypothetical protein
MTPREKAHEIIDKYIQLLPYHSKESNYKRAVASSLIAVNEIIDTIYLNYYDIGNDAYEFWEQVKEQIINLKTNEQ